MRFAFDRMASNEQIREAVDQAKSLLRKHDLICTTSIADLKAWFEAETPFENSNLDEVIRNRFFVIHELVEIEEVRKMGLQIGKRTIVDNLDKVDVAHLRATRVELMVALSLGDREHIAGRLPDIEMWIADDTVTPSQKKEYRKLLAAAKRMVEAAPVAGQAVKTLSRQEPRD